MASRSIYSQVITKAVESVQFNFYSENEVKACSVKPITSPILFDNLNRPAPDGLYDLALGPIELHDRCSTCRETSSHCSGHCGHIELALPVYNPLLFRYLVKVLKQTCTFCHRFSLSEEKMTYYANKLDRIRTGDIVNAEGLSSEKHLDDYCATPASRSENHSWTSLQLTEVMETLNSMMTELKMLKKCASCNLKSPKIASPAFGRIYQSGMSKGDVISNLLKESEGMVDDVIDPSGGEESISAVKNKSEKKRRSNNHSEKLKDQFLSPLEVREHLKRLWQNESRICSVMWDLLQEKMNSWNQSPTYEMFFLKFLLVPPNRFRPPNKVGNMLLEHPQNVHYGKVLQANMYLEEALRPLKGEKKSLIDIQVINRWINLQDTINLLIDSSTNSMRAKDTVGVRQLLEKKEGLFRQNMMGKRVNHACRSVISPDPYLAVNEIGIPPCFASKLTYPEKVTHWNEEKLREAVQNGPSVYPGATHYEDEQGIINLASMSQHQLNALAKKLLSTPGAASTGGSAENIDSTKVEGKIVYRHLQDGDVLLVNRQPTLHKPSMMAHVARVLKGEKTLRMHYANCSTYNADFDGDEMNVHFPQDEISRAEAYNIVDANQQYTVPSSGKPIRGLIQDHIVSATLLTKKDVFLTREEFQNLVYNACVLNTSPFHRQAKDCPKVSISKDDSLFITMPPALWKPKRLWTGKQVISAILHYITKGRPPFSSKKSGKVEDDPNAKGVLIKDNEMIFGIIDKEQFGKYGLVHVVHELYGAEIAGCLLSIFSRLFTAFLQMHGFTCGAVDLLLVPKAEDERRKKLEEAKNLGKEVHLQFICQYSKASEYCQMEEEIEKILRSKGQTASRSLDDRMISALNKITSGVTKATVSDGLLVKFPKNCLSLMTATGAKGSMVNFYQISSLLGQQELEGKRVPRMVSGKTLPCFPPWDSRPRAGGFISDRFLTGLHPQEYYFHCMAGRDGLVDTAVKTSTSGYLQRCLIKNLECLTVFYDQTVRDSDGSVVQFKYGEDGVDVTKRFGEDGEKAKGMRPDFAELEVIATNQSVLGQRLNHDAFDDFNGSLRNSNLDSYSDQFPESRRNKVREFLDHLTEKEKELLQVKNPKNFFDLLHLKYISSLAQPGEAVGIIAGQSIGEPSTQMTLNTFHHAGRGEVNVTMGVPRLREILMTASKNISKAYMICPLKKGKTREDAERIASKLRRIRFADLIESMDVGTVPFVVRSGQVQTIYKVRIKMYPEESYPPYSDITLEKCKTVFDTDFADKLNKEVKKVLKKSKKDDETAVEVFKESQFSEEAESLSDEDDQSNSGKAEKFDDEDEEDVEMDDEGADAQKRKAQATDEMDYEDEEDVNERSMVSDFSVEDNNLEVDDDDKAYSEYANSDGSSKNETPVEIKASPSSNRKQKKKRNEDVVAVTRGRIFECEFPIKENKHILLVPIVEKVANTIYLQIVPNIQGCNVIESKEYPGIPTIQTQGINIEALWKLSEELDVHRLHTNDISTVLELYGVEAAYATIMREVRQVFDHYGIAVNPRHLSLIADFMTFNGGYKPLNRTGISANISPFLKVSFETATKFLVNSCMHGEKDCLESPSSRIVLGQVAKVGTGCFDVLQNLHG